MPLLGELEMGGDLTVVLGLLSSVLTAYRVPLGGVFERGGRRPVVVEPWLLDGGSVACSALLDNGGELAIVTSDNESLSCENM